MFACGWFTEIVIILNAKIITDEVREVVVVPTDLVNCLSCHRVHALFSSIKKRPVEVRTTWRYYCKTSKHIQTPWTKNQSIHTFQKDKPNGVCMRRTWILKYTLFMGHGLKCVKKTKKRVLAQTWHCFQYKTNWDSCGYKLNFECNEHTRLVRRQLPKNLGSWLLGFQKELEAQSLTNVTVIITVVCSWLVHAKSATTTKSRTHCFSLFLFLWGDQSVVWGGSNFILWTTLFWKAQIVQNSFLRAVFLPIHSVPRYLTFFYFV